MSDLGSPYLKDHFGSKLFPEFTDGGIKLVKGLSKVSLHWDLFLTPWSHD